MEIIELTTDNWREYIKVYSYEDKIVQYDDFGEIISTGIKTQNILGPGKEKYYKFEDTVIELKEKNSGELKVYYLNRNKFNPLAGWIPPEFNLDNYELIRIKGTLYFVNIPSEALHSPLPKWDFKTGFIITTPGMSIPYEVEESSKVIFGNQELWKDYFDLK